MGRAWRAWLMGTTLTLLAAEPRALEVALTPAAITEALAFGRGASFTERQAFHAGYSRAPGGAVRRVSLVTEYRRIVLRAEEQRRLRELADDVRRATAALKPWTGAMEVVVELQFHPMNRLVRVPLIDVLLVPLDGPDAGMPLIPERTDRHPQFGNYWTPPPADAPWWPFPPPIAPAVAGSQSMIGGWLQARFDTTMLPAGRYEVVVKDGAQTVGTAEFDVSALR